MKKKTKNKSKPGIFIFPSNAISKAYSNYKINQEQKKIKDIRLKKLAENNQIIKEKRN